MAAVARCPSLLTLSSDTSMRKVEKLQEALPSGVDARWVVSRCRLQWGACGGRERGRRRENACEEVEGEDWVALLSSWCWCCLIVIVVGF